MSMPGVVLQALDGLNARIVEADVTGQALELAGGDEAPPWVHVFRSQVEAIRQASDALETLLRGDGGHAPHGDQVQANSGDVRGPGGALPGSSARPDKPVFELNC